MDLAIVIPVFNEETSIQSLINDLYNLTVAEKISCRFIIINDGSTDGSLAILQTLSLSIPRIEIISQTNSGHGASLLKGYELAFADEWIFQIDSDYQYTVNSFSTLWNNRNGYDLLIAEREERNASVFRNMATSVASNLVVALYGDGIKDINCPYRLIRSDKLALALQKIDKNSFAPNILVAAYFLKNNFRIFSITASAKRNILNRKSKMSFYILKGCIKTFTDTILFRFKI